MGKSLSPEAVAHYGEQGYYFPVQAMSGAEAADYRRRLEDFIARNPTGQPARKLLKSKAHLVSTALYELVSRHEILDAVEDVLGPNILCWASGVFMKDSRDPAFISWHQDAMYWGLEPADVVTTWLALTDSTVENGVMRVVPGSHHEMLPHADTFAEHNLLSRGQEIAVKVDEDQAVDLLLAAGQFSLHHVKLAHGSEPNRSDDRRIGFAIRYVASHVRQDGLGRDSAILVRGVDEHGHFDADPAPRTDFEPQALALLDVAQNKTLEQAGAVGR